MKDDMWCAGKGTVAAMKRTEHFSGVSTVLALLAAVIAASVPLMVFGPATPARAQSTIIVNTTDDENTPNDGKCSLREAIQNANDNAQTSSDCAAGSSTGEDTIVFFVAPSSAITLGSTLPAITDAEGLAIDGGNANITISGADAVRVFSVDPGAKFDLRNLTVAHGNVGVNVFGGGISNAGTLTVIDSTFSQDTAFGGGGIFNDHSGTLTVTDSTFSENKNTGFGSGIFNLGTLTVANSTFSGNDANNSGGGILNEGGATMTVADSTFSGNGASPGVGGAGILNNGAATLLNTIVANSTSGSNCGGSAPIIDGGYNIDDGTTCGFGQPTSKNSTDPQFAGGLANNGGPTQTIALQPASPAVDAIPFGANGCGATITTDQRGVSRPQGPACDIGAYELAQGASGGGAGGSSGGGGISSGGGGKHHKHHHRKQHHKRHHKHKGGGVGGINQG